MKKQLIFPEKAVKWIFIIGAIIIASLAMPKQGCAQDSSMLDIYRREFNHSDTASHLFRLGGAFALDTTIYRNHNDTIRVSMLVGMEGEPIKQLAGWMVLLRIRSFYTEDIVYLYYRMHPLPKSYTVWMSKEIK